MLLDNIQKKNNKMMTNLMTQDKIFEMLVGCILGDAHIKKRGEHQAYITFEQTIKHKDYVMHIQDVLKGVDGIELYDIKHYKRSDARHDSVNESIYLKTHSSELFLPLASMFLSEDNKKIMPLEIEKFLSPVALGY